MNLGGERHYPRKASPSEERFPRSSEEGSPPDRARWRGGAAPPGRECYCGMRDVRTDSTPTILRRVASNVIALLQAYALLGGVEARATVRDFTTGLLFLASAALLAILALTMIVVTAVLLLAVVLQPWEAAAVVFALTGLVMVIFIEIGTRRLRRRRWQNVVDAFKEDLRWLRRELLEKD